MRNDNDNQRLDASESVFFSRQLESIDQRLYETKYPEYKGRMLIPTQQGVDPDSNVYTYRMFDQHGKAKVIRDASDDLPRANAQGAETMQRMVEIGASYEYTLSEIRRAAKTGTPLDQMRAIGARRAIEELTDEYIALGNSTLGLTGVLTASGVSTYSGSGFWGTLATADPDKVAADLLGTAAKCPEATSERFSRVVVTLPFAMYNIAAQLKMSSQSNVTVLQYVLATSPYIQSVIPWYRCEAAQGSIDSTHDQICAFPQDPEVMTALIGDELRFQPPQERNYSFVVNGKSTVGGIVLRYPKAVVKCSVPTS